MSHSLAAHLFGRAESASSQVVSASDLTLPKSSTRQDYIIVGVFLALSTLATLLRGYAIVILKRKGGWDDGLMLLGFLTDVGLAATLVSSNVQFRKPLSLHWVHENLLLAWIYQFFSITALFLVKLSICVLLLRIKLDLWKAFRWTAGVVMGLIIAHWVCSIVIWGVQCIPISKFWSPEQAGQCISLTQWALSVNSITLATDIMVLALPIPLVWLLNVPVRRRLQVIALLSAGSVSIIAGCLRLYYLTRYAEKKGPLVVNIHRADMWAFIEVNLAILCGSAYAFQAFAIHIQEFSSRRSRSSGQTSEKSNKDKKTNKKFFSTFQASGFDLEPDIEMVFNDKNPHPSTSPFRTDSVPTKHSLDTNDTSGWHSSDGQSSVQKGAMTMSSHSRASTDDKASSRLAPGAGSGAPRIIPSYESFGSEDVILMSGHHGS
ncbi:Prolyl 3,4-dihydroxylase ofd1 [Teratosphaeria destructans]|uniref:Prolyl 3,4-dihydroxylase ofd1 n=1 Tax=Teratosphaeria destructans TaxID=418781 RepID=A0A9W7SWE5_9PEZI|nr:Prolyl 3,4-dihydroxylase ofd1 [Teratosphaeria destructans]